MNLFENILIILFELECFLCRAEADYVGMQLAAKACFDVRYFPLFWRRMDEMTHEKTPEFLSTHPTSEHRSTELEKHLPEVCLKLVYACKVIKLFHKY